MKKTLVTLSLLSAMATSMVAGTMALYQKTITPTAGSVVAKTFIFDAARSDTVSANVKIAPGDEITYKIKCINYTGTYASPTAKSETSINITVSDPELTGDLSGFNHIKVSVVAPNDTELTKDTAEEVEYQIKVTWYSTLANATDTTKGNIATTDLEATEALYNAADLAKQGKSLAIAFSVTGTQVVEGSN
ncbi:MAG: hypothetical protein WC196_07415 [Bacilli bacterium]